VLFIFLSVPADGHGMGKRMRPGKRPELGYVFYIYIYTYVYNYGYMVIYGYMNREFGLLNLMNTPEH